MSKDDELPDIPSWEELGISPEELAELEADIAAEEAEPQAGGPKTPKASPETVAGAGKPTPKASRPTGGSAKASGAPTGPKAGASPARAGGGPGKPKRRLFFWGRRSKRAKGAAPSPPPAAAAPPVKSPASPPPRASRGSQTTKKAAPAFRGPLTAVLLLLIAWFSSSSRDIPGPVSSDAPDSVFSAERAWTHLEEISQAAHPTGSAEHARVREYLLRTLRGLGLDPELQVTTEVMGRGAQARAATVRNIVARIPGSNGGSGAVLATAHYDSRQVSKGAGDDGIGVVALLESARALRAGPRLAHDVILLITDAEELGLLGARAFVDRHPWMQDVRLALSFEMRGGGGPALMFETGQENGWVVQQFAEAGPHPRTNSLGYEVYKRLPNDTDFTPFKEAGTQGLNFAGIGRAHVYHQAYDDIGHVSKATVQHHGVQALALLRHFGNADLTEVNGPDRVYFSLPFVGTITYLPTVSYALSGVLLLALVAILFGARGSKLRMRGVLSGTLISVLVVAGCAAVGWGLLQWLPRFHPETGRLHGSLFRSEGWYVGAIVAFAVGIAGLGRWFGAGRVSLGELAIGGALVPAVLAIAAGFWTPMGAMNLQWPAIAALLAGAVGLGVGQSGEAGWVRWLLWVLLAVPVLLFLVPLTELVWLAMSFQLAPVLGLLVGLGVLLLWPVLEVVREPKGWVSPVVGVAAGAALVGVGLFYARPSAERPLPSTLIYALDRAEGTALWATDAARAEAVEARLDLVWAAERAGPADTTRALSHLLPSGRVYAVSEAPLATLPVPRIAFESDSVASDLSRSGRVRVASASGAELLSFVFPEEGPRPISINGRSLRDLPDLQGLEHWGMPEGSVVLEFEVAPTMAELQFQLLEVHLRPESIVGPGVFERPPELAPDLTQSSDRAVVRTPVRISLADGQVELVGEVQPAAAPDAVADGGLATAGAVVSVELFARDRISGVPPEFAISFSPDGRTAYFNRSDDARTDFALLATLERNGEWGEPEAVPFASTGMDIDPFVTLDGDRIWFASDRPRPGAPDGSFSLWYVDRTATGWSEPIDPGPPLNSDSSDVFVSQARDGLLVFSSRRDGPRRIYATRPAGAGWEPPTLLRFGELDVGSNPLIAPDGSYILLSLDGPDGSPDLFASCRTADGGWGQPQRLPDGINSPFTEFAPALHPIDGGLLFTSERPGILGPVPDSVRPPGDIYRADPNWRVPCGS